MSEAKESIKKNIDKFFMKITFFISYIFHEDQTMMVW